MVRDMYNYLHTLWLFTYSDIKIIIKPKALFGIAALVSGRNLTKDERPEIRIVINCVPLIILRTWINLLPLDINNQRSPESILED